MIENILEASEEQLLAAYLNSRGINAKFVTKDTKIAHAKSAQYAKWKADHWDRFANEEVNANENEIVDEVYSTGVQGHVSQAALDSIKHKRNVKINLGTPSNNPKPKFLAKKPSKKASLLSRIFNKEESEKFDKFSEAKTIQGTALDKFRQSAAERAKKHDDIEKEMKARHAAGKENMKGAIDRLEKHLNKEAADAGVSKAKETSFHKKLDKLVHSTFGKRKDEMKMKEEVMNEDSELSALADKHGWSYKRNTYGAELHHPKHGSIGMDRYGHWYHHTDKKTNKITHHGEYGELSKHLSSLKEEVEQIDEISKSTLASYKDKSTASMKNARANRDAAEPGKNMSKGFADLHAKSDAIVKKRVKGLTGYLQRKHGMKPGYSDERKTTSEEVENVFEAPDDKNSKINSWSQSVGKRSEHDSYYKFIAGKAKLGKPLTNKEKDFARSYTLLKQEEVEQIDELTTDLLKRYKDKAAAQASAADKEGDYDKGNKRFSGIVKATNKQFSNEIKKLKKEDTFQDSYAATQTTGMEVVDLPAQDNVNRKQLSKSARIIKSVYKKLNMKEELYDHEKEDKSVATYGKKPNMVKTDKKMMGDNQPQAAAVLTGGKTLTGQTRDTLEIDPLMRKPGPPLDQNKKV